MRAVFLSIAMLATGAAAGAAIEQSQQAGRDLRLIGGDIPAAHKARWRAASARYKECPSCIPQQAFPDDS